jgi:hypothetical protein
MPWLNQFFRKKDQMLYIWSYDGKLLIIYDLIVINTIISWALSFKGILAELEGKFDRMVHFLWSQNWPPI